MISTDHLWAILTSAAAGTLAASIVQITVGRNLQTKLETQKGEIQQQLDQLRATLEEKGRVIRERWQIKREACLSALGIVDSVMTHIPRENNDRPGELLKIKRLPIKTQEVRDAMNRLILSCEESRTVHLFLQLVGFSLSGDPVTDIDPALVQEFRNAVRRELGFGGEIELPLDLAWISCVHGDGVLTD